jgi:hypothetical protein
MANDFKLKTKTAVGTTPTVVYTVPASPTTVVVIGLTIANIASGSVNASAQIVTRATTGENADNVYFIKDIPIPAGSSVEIMGGNKINLEYEDVIKITSNTASSLDVALSIMEIS